MSAFKPYVLEHQAALLDGESPGYVAIPHVIQHSRLLKANEKFVYVMLLHHLRGHAYEVAISLRTVMGDTALSRRTVIRAIARLKELGLIHCASRAGIVNRYAFADPKQVLTVKNDPDNYIFTESYKDST